MWRRERGWRARQGLGWQAVETAPRGGCGHHETALRRLGSFAAHRLAGKAPTIKRPNARRRVSWRVSALSRDFNPGISMPTHPRLCHLAAIGTLLLAALTLAACGPNMQQQPKYKPEVQSDFFADGQADR